MPCCKTLRFNWGAFELHVARHSVVLNSLLLKQTDCVYDPPSVYEQECYTQFQRTLRCYCPFISVNFILVLQDPENWLATKYINMYSLSFFCGLSHCVYRMSQEEWTKLREGVPYVKIYRYNSKYLYPKLNGYGDNGQRSLKVWQLLHTYWLPNSY